MTALERASVTAGAIIAALTLGGIVGYAAMEWWRLLAVHYGRWRRARRQTHAIRELGRRGRRGYRDDEYAS